jgi:type IV secretion system protein TrbB
VHANCAVSSLLRLEQLIQEAVVTVPRDLIVQAIDVIVFLSGRGTERRVETVAELADLDQHGNYVLKPLAPPALHAIPATRSPAHVE